MQLNVYAIRDVKAECFGTPFFVTNDGIAIRGFGDGVCNPENGYLKHASDFVLYRIGTLDNVSGELKAIVPPVYLSCASDFVPEVKKEVEK